MLGEALGVGVGVIRLEEEKPDRFSQSRCKRRQFELEWLAVGTEKRRQILLTFWIQK